MKGLNKDFLNKIRNQILQRMFQSTIKNNLLKEGFKEATQHVEFPKLIKRRKVQMPSINLSKRKIILLQTIVMLEALTKATTISTKI